MNVGAERTAKREPVGAGLLLNDAPGGGLAGLHGDEMLDQLRPLEARLDFDDAMLGIKRDDPPHRCDIKEHRIAGDLLTAHRVASASNADPLALRACGQQCRPQRRLRIDGDDTVDAHGIELRMDIVDENVCSGTPRSKRKQRKPGGGVRHGAKRPTSCRHFGSWAT
jgi:hypothetical protein